MIESGRIISDRYLVMKHIGSGGMQDVYLATDKLLERDVALKTPQIGQHNKRFRASALISARVNHYGIAKTLDHFTFNDSEYLVEEYVDGENLEQKLAHFHFLDPHAAARILHNLSKGIAASHNAGVIHRDLKPSNIMASSGSNLEVLKITDFGIATLTEEVFEDAARSGDITRSTSGTVKGALPYMAPEMMFRKPGEVIGEKADIWSLGAMMFRLLTGEYPFGVFLEAAVNVKTRNRQAWPNFMTSNPQFKPLAIDLQNIVDKCLAYDPDERPTARHVAEQCAQLCYISSERHGGTVFKLIKNGYAGLASGDKGNVFFSMESVYGLVKPNIEDNRFVHYSSFPGYPLPRAHPVVVVDKL
jgi:serine/threonine-protein kinase